MFLEFGGKLAKKERKCISHCLVIIKTRFGVLVSKCTYCMSDYRLHNLIDTVDPSGLR